MERDFLIFYTVAGLGKGESVENRGFQAEKLRKNQA